MNYIKQMNQFYKVLSNNPLSSNAQCLYFFLLNKDNELGWIKEFTIANLIICGFTSLSRQALDRARNELVTKGYIKYRKGVSNQAGKYLIVDFDTQDDTQNDTQDDTQDDTQSGHKVSTLNKLNKTKQDIKEKNIKKEKYGQLQNVALTVEEHEKLKAEYPDYEERIERLSLYIGSKGDKYKSHYATIKNWARKDGVTTKPKPKDVFALE
jgi:hypothetical protein